MQLAIGIASLAFVIMITILFVVTMRASTCGNIAQAKLHLQSSLCCLN